jgi:hypothetical protein
MDPPHDGNETLAAGDVDPVHCEILRLHAPVSGYGGAIENVADPTASRTLSDDVHVNSDGIGYVCDASQAGDPTTCAVLKYCTVNPTDFPPENVESPLEKKKEPVHCPSLVILPEVTRQTPNEGPLEIPTTTLTGSGREKLSVGQLIAGGVNDTTSVVHTGFEFSVDDPNENIESSNSNKFCSVILEPISEAVNFTVPHELDVLTIPRLVTLDPLHVKSEIAHCALASAPVTETEISELLESAGVATTPAAHSTGVKLTAGAAQTTFPPTTLRITTLQLCPSETPVKE